MIHLRAVSSKAGARARAVEPRAGRPWLYKEDHPRGIDRYIDFFGDRARRPGTDADGCGEVFLESLA
jgi:hypothetical protein